MASTNKTSLGFNQWLESDKPNVADFNSDNTLLDTKIVNLSLRQMYKKSSIANPSTTINTYGTVINLTPATNYIALFPKAIDIVFGGTFGSETVTANITVTFSDITTATIIKTATAIGTTSLTNSDLMTLVKDGVYITKIAVESESTIASSAVTVTFNHCGFYL